MYRAMMRDTSRDFVVKMKKEKENRDRACILV